MRTLCTFLPIVTTDITTGSSSWKTTSSKSELVKQRLGSSGCQISSPPRSSLFSRINYAWKQSSLLQKILLRCCSTLHGPVSHGPPQGTPFKFHLSPSSLVRDPKLYITQCRAEIPCKIRTRPPFVALDPYQSSEGTSTFPRPLARSVIPCKIIETWVEMPSPSWS